MGLFAAAALLLLWVLAGWPLWLAWRARRRPRPVRKSEIFPTASIIIPVRNGAPYLRRKLESVLAQDYPQDLLEILVVSDGSTDATESIAGSFSSRGVRLLRQPPRGKPAALNAALQVASGEIVVFTDVRQPLAPDSLRRLAACFADSEVGAVSGELRILGSDGSAEAAIGAYWRFESWIRRSLSQIDSMLGATGPFYAIRRWLVCPLPEEVLLDDVFLPLNAFFRGFRLVVEPEAVAWDYPTSLRTEFRRKVRTLAGNYQLLRYYPQLLGRRNRLWLDYVSYKLGRLALPFLLLMLFAGSLRLPDPWRPAVLAAQLAGYLLAAVDPLVPEGFVLKRLTAPAWTFLSMMVASVLALQVWFVPPQRLWVVTQTHVKEPPGRQDA